MKSADDNQSKRTSLLGVGLDNEDGETRLTRGKNFTLLGGSETTHAVMRETAIKVNERLDRRGKSLDEVSPAELTDIIMDVSSRVGGDAGKEGKSERKRKG